MEIQLILTASFVTLGLSSVQPHEDTAEQFQNLFDSIAKSEKSRSNVYRETLKNEIADERLAFDVMKEAVHTVRTRNSYRTRTSDKESNPVHYKRETSSNKITMIKDTDHFDQEIWLLPTKKLAVVYYFYELCDPCKELSPLYDELPEKYPKVSFFKVDIEECEELAELQNVRRVPVIMFYRDRQKLGCLADPSIKQLMQKIREHS